MEFLVAKWRIFRGPIKAKPSKLENFIKATVCLHNYLRLTDTARYVPTGFTDSESNSGIIVQGDWRREVADQNCLVKIPKSKSNQPSFEASKVRNTFKEYFNSETGALPWQSEYVESCGHNPVSRK